MVIGALGVFLHVRGALCTIWKLEAAARGTPSWASCSIIF